MSDVKTIVIPISQLVKANEMYGKIHQALIEFFRKSYYIDVPKDIMQNMKELKECIMIEGDI